MKGDLPKAKDYYALVLGLTYAAAPGRDSLQAAHAFVARN
jgi:hypothetical protein